MNAANMTGEDIQVENGFTKVSPAIFELLARARFTATEHRLLMFLIRKTYGFNKKVDEISLSQWAEGTNTDKANVSHALDHLLTLHVISREPGRKKGIYAYGFNKYFEQWDADLFARTPGRRHHNSTAIVPTHNDERCATEQPLSLCTTPIVPTHNETLFPCTTTIDKKDTFTKDKSAAAPPSPSLKPRKSNPAYELAAALAEVCAMDLRANEGRLLREAKTLSKARPEPTPALLREHYGDGGWWWWGDWRGRKKQHPQPTTIRETWGKWAVQPPSSTPSVVYS